MPCLRVLPLFLVLALAAPACAAVSLSKGLAAYARDMEFYYVEHREEVLPGLLRTFDKAGALADPRRQLTVAAFLAEAMRGSASARRRLLPPPDGISRDGRRTLAWAVHLARLDGGDALVARLLGPEESLLRQQICRSPAPVAAWNIFASRKEVQMYWAAYTASGQDVYLDAIVNAALRYARLKGAGLRNDPAFAAGEAAAASLYEFAPRHAAVSARLEERLRGSSGYAAETLRLILRK